MSLRRRENEVEAVIFDLDDTLIDWSEPAHSWEAFTRPMADNVHRFLVEQGHHLCDVDRFFHLLRRNIQRVWTEAKRDWTGASFGDALKATCDEVGIDLSTVDIEALMRAYAWRPMPGVELYDDALDVLHYLRNRGFKIGLITNSFFPMWMRDVELEHYGLIDFLDARITSGDTGYMKPHPAIYERMLGLLQVAPEAALFVGDRPENDIAGANESGLISVLIDPPHLERERKDFEPDYTITALSELIPILERLAPSRRE